MSAERLTDVAEDERWAELREKHRADVDRDEGKFDLTDWDNA